MTKRRTALLLIALVGIAAVATVSVMAARDNAIPAPSPAPPSQSADPLTVELTSASDSYTYGDNVTFTTAIRNNSDSPRSFTFNSTCTQGVLSIDQQPTQATQICGQALTEVSIQPGESISRQFEFRLVREFSEAARSAADGEFIELEGELKLKPGSHSASLEWQDVSSKPFAFEVNE